MIYRVVSIYLVFYFLAMPLAQINWFISFFYVLALLCVFWGLRVLSKDSLLLKVSFTIYAMLVLIGAYVWGRNNCIGTMNDTCNDIGVYSACLMVFTLIFYSITIQFLPKSTCCDE